MNKIARTFSIRTGLEIVAVIAIVLALFDWKGPRRVQDDSLLKLQVAGALPEQPIDGFFPVESDGSVVLGPSYGSVKLRGLTVPAAHKKILEHLGSLLPVAEVSLTLVGSSDDWRRDETIAALDSQIVELQKRLDFFEYQFALPSMTVPNRPGMPGPRVTSVRHIGDNDHDITVLQGRTVCTAMMNEMTKTPEGYYTGGTSHGPMYFSIESIIKHDELVLGEDEQGEYIGLIHVATNELAFVYDPSSKSQVKRSNDGFPPELLERFGLASQEDE